MKCSICRSEAGRIHTFRERMFGTREEFEYWECSDCGCLQIMQIPDNLERHYPSDYYSYSLRVARWKTWYFRTHFAAPALMGRLRRCPVELAAVIAAKPNHSTRILDVGCGSGGLIHLLRNMGFNAHGIDPYLEVEFPHIRKLALADVEGGWDIIMFHHSLEHMVDNVAVLREARSKLSANGLCLIRIPVVNWAWERYGRDWVQIDAPRHFVLHTKRSIQLAAEAAGFDIEKTIYDSFDFQLYGSELYKRDLALSTTDIKTQFTKKELANFRAQADRLNAEQGGDQASFYLRPNSAKN